jgi:hypothetical protein
MGGIHTEIRLPRRRRGQRNSTLPDIITAVRLLVRVANDDLIAGILNRNKPGVPSASCASVQISTQGGWRREFSLARASLIHTILHKTVDALSSGLVSHHLQIGSHRASARFDALTWEAARLCAARGRHDQSAMHRHRRRETTPPVPYRGNPRRRGATLHGRRDQNRRHGKIARWL